MTELFEGA
jgi:hypothetical protein